MGISATDHMRSSFLEILDIDHFRSFFSVQSGLVDNKLVIVFSKLG